MTNQPHMIVIIATCPNEEEAALIARKLVAARYAACVQLNPIHSIYHWQGKIEEDSEVRLLIKTTERRFDDVVKLFRSLTKNQCPEIISYQITQGTKDYLEWIATETQTDDR